MSTFVEKFEKLCAGERRSPSFVCEDIGISRATYSAWRKKGTTPRSDTVGKIADYFGVPADYLLNDNYELPVPKQITKAKKANEVNNRIKVSYLARKPVSVTEDIPMSDEEKAVIRQYRGLTPQSRRRLSRYMAMMAMTEKTKTGSRK